MHNQIMVDLETTGLNAGRNAMIQLAAVRFNLEEDGSLSPDFFDECLRIPKWRSWDEGTRNWWLGDATRRKILEGIQARMRDPKEVIEQFRDWVFESDSPVFWSKPSHFDWGFVQSYCEDFGVVVPFHYRYANDMNSFIRGIHAPEEPPGISVPMRGDAHNALYDVINQIETLWEHLKIARQNREKIWRLEQLDD